MRSSYINNADKQVVVSLAGCVGMADTIREKKFRNSEAAMPYIEKVQEYAQKAIDEIVADVDPDQGTGIVRFAENCELVIMPKYDARVKKDWVIVDRKDITDIISQAMTDCVFCEKTGREAKNCPLKGSLLRCGICSSEDSVMKDLKSEDCPFKR